MDEASLVSKRESDMIGKRGTREGARMGMRSRTKLLAFMAGVMVMATPGAALATAPEVVYDATESNSVSFAAGEFCDFAVQLDSTARVRVTLFFDNEGNLIREVTHRSGIETLTAGDKSTQDHYAGSIVFDAVDETLSFIGSPWNVHMVGGGILVNDSGRIVIDFASGEETVNGPHDAWEGDPAEAICAALSP